MRYAICLLLMLFSAEAFAAIDSAEKRRSVANINGWAQGPGVTPNASKDQEWRQESGYSYSGIAADSPATPSSQLLMRLLQEDLQ